MRLGLLIAAALLFLPEAALACRCRAANTAEKRADYAGSIAATSHLVAIGRFDSTAREGRRRFRVRDRIAGAPERRPWVREHGLLGGFGELIYSGSCVGVESWSDADRVIVLRRRPDESDYAPAYEADSCATRFLNDNPDALARIRERSR